MQLEFEPARTAELEASLNLAEEYLRHLLVRIGD
jgi:ribosomal protein S6